jgi:hypothetical protein
MKNILGALIVAGAILISVAVWVYFTKVGALPELRLDPSVPGTLLQCV